MIRNEPVKSLIQFCFDKIEFEKKRYFFWRGRVILFDNLKSIYSSFDKKESKNNCLILNFFMWFYFLGEQIIVWGKKLFFVGKKYEAGSEI